MDGIEGASGSRESMYIQWGGVELNAMLSHSNTYKASTSSQDTVHSCDTKLCFLGKLTKLIKIYERMFRFVSR